MNTYKAIFHILAFMKKIFYKIYFRNAVKIGKKTTWRRRFNIWIEKGAYLSIGENCFFNNDCSITCLESVIIGDDTIFGENVKIYDQNHRFSDLSKKISKQGYSVKSIKIGQNCWIGSNVIILKGTKVGNNCVIGAGVVLSGVIPDNTVIRCNDAYKIEKIWR